MRKNTLGPDWTCTGHHQLGLCEQRNLVESKRSSQVRGERLRNEMKVVPVCCHASARLNRTRRSVPRPVCHRILSGTDWPERTIRCALLATSRLRFAPASSSAMSFEVPLQLLCHPVHGHLRSLLRGGQRRRNLRLLQEMRRCVCRGTSCFGGWR